MENSIIFNGPSIIMIITKKYYRWINTKSYTIVIIVIIMMNNDGIMPQNKWTLKYVDLGK